MKRVFLLSILLIVLGSCAKEVNVINDEITPVEQEEGTVVSFSAVIPEFVSATKASVNNVSFAWEEGDQIAIPATGIDGGYAIFTTKASDGGLGVFKCTLKSGEALKAGTALYPASRANGTYSTVFSSQSEARSAFKMDGEYTVGASSITFEHKSALVCMSFTNVPSFANKLVVNDGSSDVATISFTSPSSSEVFYIPIDPDDTEHTYSFNLQEGSNIIRQATKTATLAADTFYTANVAVGIIITLNDAASVGKNRLSVWKSDDNSKNAHFSKDGTYPAKLNSSGGSYYAVLNTSSFPWATAGTLVGVSYDDNNSDDSACATTIYLRDMYLSTVSGETYLSGNYRIFPHGTTSYTYLYGSYGSGTYYTPETISFHVTVYAPWTRIYAYAYGGTMNSEFLGSWPGTQFSLSEGNAVLTFNSTLTSSLKGKSFYIKFDQNYDGNLNESTGILVDLSAGSNDHLTDIYMTVAFDNNGELRRVLSWTGTDYTSEILVEPLGEFPGTLMPTVPTSFSMGSYIDFPSSHVGKTVNFKFNDNEGGNTLEWNNLPMTRDWDYGF